MKQTLLIISLLLAAIPAVAKFTVHSVSGNVSLERAGKTQKLSAGMEVGGVDKIIVGANSMVEIHNSADSKVSRCETPGSYTPTRIMMDAHRKAASKTGNIAKTARFGANRKAAGTVYSEGCLVTRALESYDPEGASVQVDAAQLARAIALKINGAPSDSLPALKACGADHDGIGLEFAVENIYDYPVYVNVVKFNSKEVAAVDGAPKMPQVFISELGQPVGCYILLPGQSLMRAHSRELDPDQQHVMILTPCYFDIDEVIEKVPASTPDTEGPVLGSSNIYVTKL